MYTGVDVIESSRAGGAMNMPEHAASLMPLTPHAAGTSTKTIITVDPTKPRQKITGFGGALTEVTTSTIAILSAAQQTEIYTKLFSPMESHYTMTRTHIGSSDFALSAYTYDDNGGTADPTLANFSIKNDMDYIVPGLKAAGTAAGAPIKILGSMWTAPPWMKDTPIYNGGSVTAANYGVLAQYFAKYVQAYTAQGLTVWGITPTNEPLGVGGSRESQIFLEPAMNTFIQANLGPALQPLGTKIFIYDHNKGAGNATAELVWSRVMFADTKTNPFIAGVALHWYNSTFMVFEQTLDALHALDGTKELLFDEGTADGFIFNGTMGAVVPVNHMAPWWQNDDWFWNVDQWDWGADFATLASHPQYAPVSRYARDIIVGLNHWYTGWIDWCAVVNKYGAQDAKGGGIGMASPSTYSNTRGQPGVSHIENGIPASIMVDEDPSMTNQTGTIYYTPIFYTMRQFSKYILPGATVLSTTNSAAPMGDNTTNQTQTLFATSAQNPDGSTAVVMFNSATMPVSYTVNVGSQAVDGTLPAQAIQTLVWHK
jgi:glucosylceramidase